jgi:exodeoxyribonuclease V gamma subunit
VQLVDPSLMSEKRSIADDDDSIQCHACHSTMREVEVLHDQLLALLERHPDVSPTDIVVMTPDIDIYAGAIDAGFGTASKALFIP